MQAELEHMPAEDSRPALRRLTGDPELLAWHRAQLAATTEKPTLENFNAATVTAAWKAEHATNLDELCRWLEPAEILALLNQPTGLDRLQTLQAKQTSEIEDKHHVHTQL